MLRIPKATPYLLIIALFLLAFALRVFKLSDSAIWWDEAWSIWVAGQSFDQTTHITASDVHPPLYQWALHGWVRLAGISAFSARYLSLIGGLLTVASVYAITKRLGGRKAGLIALGMTAISPFFIHWSQEARMYAQAGLFTALTVYAYVRVRRDWRQLRWWVLLVLAGASVPLTQYLGALTLVLINLHLLFTLKQSPRPFYPRWVSAMLVTGLILGAWLLYAIGLTRSGSAESGANPAFVFQLASVLWSSGTSLNIIDYQWAGLAFVVVYSIGLWRYARKDRSSVILAGLFAVVPPLLIYILGILETRFYAPKPEERYFIIFAPLVFVGIGIAIQGLSQWKQWAGILALSALTISYGAGIVRDIERRYLQDDYITLTNMIDALAQPDELIFFISDDRYPLVYYHLNRADGWQTPYTPLGIKPFDESALLDLFDTYPRFWVIFIEDYLTDPEHQTMAWFDQYQAPTFQASFGHNRVLYYGESVPQSAVILSPPITQARPADIIYGGGANLTASLSYHDEVIFQQTTTQWDLVQFPIYPAYPSGRYTLTLGDQSYPITVTQANHPTQPQTRLDADFGDLTLTGYTLKNHQVEAGGTFEIILHWRVNAVPHQQYTVFAQLIGPFRQDGPVWSNDDRYPADTPTTHLWAGLEFNDIRHLSVPHDMPAGTYDAYFGLYQLETGERLLLKNGADHVAISGLVVK
jgi:4-amino-4-deoxy-L-arabinose transferase-like glycosyltransferase